MLKQLFLVTLAFGMAGWPLRADPSPGANRLAILSDTIASLDTSRVKRLEEGLRQAGYSVQEISCDQLASGNTFNRALFDGLLLTESPFFPGIAKENVLAFLRQGGDLVLMGGRAFSEPVAAIGGQWLSARQYEETLKQLTPTHSALTFEQGDLSAWKHNTNVPEHHSVAVVDQGEAGRAMRLDIKDTGAWQWDMFSAAIPKGFSNGDNVLLFWAKGSETTPQVSVGLQEAGGASWHAAIELTTDWQLHAVPVSEFTSAGSTGRVHLEKVRQITFGLAQGLATFSPGDHRIWIDRIATARGDAPDHLDFGSPLDLNVFEDYEPYVLSGIARVAPAPGQAMIPESLEIKGSFTGNSALGVALLNKSCFFPLLSAFDSNGRDRGWGAGMLVNFAGPYQGSQWLLFGLEDPDFYQAPAFVPMLANLLKEMRDHHLVATAAAENEAQKTAALPLTAPAPAGPVRLSADQRQFVDLDGKPLFLIGCNYTGNEDALCRMPNRVQLETDFRLAHEAGINAMRMWVGSDEKDAAATEAVRQCARKYGIYLLFQISQYNQPDGDAADATVRETAERWKDEPMVIGYDLGNEPYLTSIAPIRYAGQASPVVALQAYEKYAGKYDQKAVDQAVLNRHEWPPIAPWVSAADAREIYAANSLFEKQYLAGLGIKPSTSLDGMIHPLPLDGEWGELATAVNGTFAGWIDHLKETIHAADPNHFITVGYNTPFSGLPANAALDFQNTHTYVPPTSLEAVKQNVGTMDRLAQIWPNQPITIGEFGYSNGITIGRGFLDLHTSAVGEMMNYLYAWAHGYAGCMKWMMHDEPMAMEKDNAPWISARSRIFEGRLGLFYYNGTPADSEKPIAHALRFLSDTIAAGAERGSLALNPATDISIGASYVYRGKSALFIGDTHYQAPEISFQTDAGVPANVMLRWDATGLTLMATADTKLQMQPEEFCATLPPNAGVTGKSAGISWKGPWLEIGLLEGETVRIQ